MINIYSAIVPVDTAPHRLMTSSNWSMADFLCSIIEMTRAMSPDRRPIQTFIFIHFPLCVSDMKVATFISQSAWNDIICKLCWKNTCIYAQHEIFIEIFMIQLIWTSGYYLYFTQISEMHKNMLKISLDELNTIYNEIYNNTMKLNSLCLNL